MDRDSPRIRALGWSGRPWLVVAGVWSAVAAFSVSQIWIARTALGHPPPLGPLLRMELPVWLFWALLTVPIVMLSRRFPLERERARTSVPVHAAAAVLVALVAVAFQTLWYQAFNPYPMQGSSVTTWFWQYFRQYFAYGFVIYWATVGVYHAFINHARYRERETAAARAEAELTEARLEALRMQIRPHFLFNTLNSISALLEEQPAEARRVIAQLGDLLRASLRTDALHVVPLEDELAFLTRYIEIERIRFAERLDVSLEVEPEVRRAAIPSFLLQPLVENAIRHGIGPREEGGHLWLRVARRNGSLVIHVEDDGAGPGPWPGGEGIGLSNTRRRLRELYGGRQSLSLTERRAGGTDVRVEIPFHIVRSAS